MAGSETGTEAHETFAKKLHLPRVDEAMPDRLFGVLCLREKLSRAPQDAQYVQ